jgi:hypothetical protein
MQRKKPDCQAHMYAYQLQILTLTQSIRQDKHSHQPKVIQPHFVTSYVTLNGY